MPTCPSCGNETAPDARACPTCGRELAGATAEFKAVSIEEAAGAGAPATAEGPALFVRKGPERGDTFFLDRERLTIGRDPESDIFLNDVTVSRQHGTIERTAAGVVIRDEGSLNGTLVNGACVEQATLAEGDIVQIGTFQMVFHEGGA